MSKYDKEREEMGVSISSSSSTKTSKTSKYADEREKYKQKEEPVKQKFDLPSMNPAKLPLMQQVLSQPKTNQTESPKGVIGGINESDFSLDGVLKGAIALKNTLNYPFAKAAEHSVPDAPMIGRREDGSYGNLPGPTARETFAVKNPIASTGNETADKVLGFSGEMGSYMFNPAGGIGQGAIGMYKALSPVVDRATSKAVSKLPALGQKVAKEATREGVTAAAYAPMRSLIEGEGNAKEIAKRTAIEGGLGVAIGGTLPLVGKAIGRIIEKYRPKQVQPTQPLLSLPEGRLDQRLKAAEQRGITKPGLDPIANEHQFGLPKASELSQNKVNVTKEAINDLSSIENELKLIESKYQQAINDQYEYLRESLKKRGGVQQGNIIRNVKTGDVMNRYGRQSKNPQWYRDFHAENGKVPSRKELYELAKKHVDEGYRDDLYEIPSWSKENSYIETVDALTQVRNTIRQTLKTMDSSDALLKDEVLSFDKKSPKNEPFSVDDVPEKVSDLGTVNEIPVHEKVSSEREFALYKDSLMKKNPNAKNILELDLSEEEFQKLLSLREKAAQEMRSQNVPEGVQAMSLSESPGVSIEPKITRDIRQVQDKSQAYAGNQIPFRRAEVQNERTISRNQVVKNIRKNLGITVDTGRLSSRGSGILGEYKIKPEVVRSKMAEDLQVISHEIGHHLDNKHKLQVPAYQDELYNLLKQNDTINVSSYRPDQLHAEGIAEFTRLYLTDPQQAMQLAPKFLKHFEQSMPSDVLRGLEKTRSDIDTWITQGEYNQAKGLIDFTSGSKKDPISRDKLYTRFVDDLNPIKLAEKALKGAIGLGNESIYKMARLSRGIAERAKLAITRGIYDSSGNKVSDGLSHIVKPLEELGVKEKDFATYLAVKHAMDLKAMGKQIPFTDGQINSVLRKLDTPEIQGVQKKIIEFNNHLLDILIDADILSAEAVRGMKEKYPNYVPFMRYFDDDAVAGFKNGGFGAAKGFANITNPLKRMSEEGSLRTIINPIESMVKNTFLVMNAAAKNKVGLLLDDLAKIEGAGAWVEHIGEGGSSPHEHIVSVYKNGEKQQLKIRNPELYNAMLSLDAESTNSLVKFLGGVASVLRAGATLTPEFMVRNPFRDVAEATLNSVKYGFNPIDFFKGFFHVVGKTETFDQFLSSGGAMGTMMSLDREVNREALKKVFRESLKDKTMNIITSPMELAKVLTGITPAKKVIGGLRHAAEISELSTRVGAFQKVLKKTGSFEEAAYTAKDLMDFNRAGSSVRQANKAVAFLNAQIQGTDKMFRSFWGDGAKDYKTKATYLTRAFTTLVLPAAALYYWNQNLPPEQKKVYDNIPQWQKDTFFVIGIPGTNEFARIPKPFEAGVLYATGTERMLRWLQENDPEAFKDYGGTVMEAMTPPVLFSALTPMLEAITNHSIFRNAPIVPMGEQRFEKKDQYGIYTSETAKVLGNLVSKVPGLDDTNAASPRIIDNTISGYTAGLGKYAVSGIDKAIIGLSGKDKTPLPQKKLTEQPLMSAFFSNTSGGGQVRQDFYDRWDKLSKQKASADRNEVSFREPDYTRMKNAKSAIDKIMKQYKVVQKDRKMTPSEKRDKLDMMDSSMNQIASKALGK